MDLKITTTPAQIGIKTTPARLEIQQPKADVALNIEHPRVEIDSEPIQVQIDQYQCFAEAGLKNFLDLTKEGAQIAKNKAMQGIERIVSQGNALAAIHQGGNPIADQAEENAFHLDDAEFNFDLIPKSRPKIDFIGGEVDIKVIEGKVNPKVKVNKPIVDYTRGKVEIYLKQKNSINIEYVGKKFNQIIG